jgi:hypothetical protein
MESIQDIVNHIKFINDNSITLKENEHVVCSRCGIIYARDHIFTQSQFDSPCPWTINGSNLCGGKWIKTTNILKAKSHWTW